MNKKILKQLRKMTTNKKGLSAAVVAVGIMSTTLIPQNAYAHGFVEKPGSRAALCSQNYGALNLNCGNVMYEPQSLEAPKGFHKVDRLMGKLLQQEACLVGFLINKQLIDGLRIRLRVERIHSLGNTLLLI